MWVIKSRMFVNALDEQFWAIDLPALECLDGALMVQGALRNMVVVGGQLLGERGIELGGAGEAALLYQVADAALKPLDHAVGLRVSGRAQAVLDAHGRAGHIEHVAAQRCPGLAGTRPPDPPITPHDKSLRTQFDALIKAFK